MAESNIIGLPVVSVAVEPQYLAANETKDVFGLVSVAAPTQEEEKGQERAPLRLCAVIDKSGSMRGGKIELVKQTLLFMITQLTDKDSFGIVLFDSSVATAFDLQKMTSSAKHAAEAVVRQLHSGSCTNLSGGLFTGLQNLAGKSSASGGLKAARAALTAMATAKLSLRAKAKLLSDQELPLPLPHGRKQSKKGGMFAGISNILKRHRNVAANDVPVQQQMDTDGSEETAACRIQVKVDEKILRVLLASVSARLPDGQIVAGMKTSNDKISIWLSNEQVEVIKNAGGKIELEAAVSYASDTVSISLDLPATINAETKTHVDVPLPLFEPDEKEKPQKLDDEVVSCFLFTDGLANEGITENGPLCQKTLTLLQEAGTALGKTPTLYTFGFGRDHSQDMLEALAETGRGMYYYVEDEDKIAGAFADALGGLLSVVLQEVEVELRPLNGASIVDVKTTYPKRQTENGATVFTIGELFSEERRDTLVMLKIPEEKESVAAEAAKAATARGENAPSVSVLQVLVRYHSIELKKAGQEMKLLQLYRPLEVTPEMAAMNGVNEEIERQRVRLETVSLLDELKNLRQQNGGYLSEDMLEAARAKVTGTVDSINRSPCIESDMAQQCVSDLTNFLGDIQNVADYDARAIKKAAWISAQHKYQRSAMTECYTEAEEDACFSAMACKAGSAYVNRSKLSLRKKISGN